MKMSGQTSQISTQRTIQKSAQQAIRGQGVVAVIEQDQRFLMIQRPRDLAAGGLWCFVGGRMEAQETQGQALIREVREEVGLEIQPLGKVWQCLSLNRDWLLHCWRVRHLSTTVRPDSREVLDHAWLTVSEIRALPEVIPSVLDYFRFMKLI